MVGLQRHRIQLDSSDDEEEGLRSARKPADSEPDDSSDDDDDEVVRGENVKADISEEEVGCSGLEENSARHLLQVNVFLD